MKIPILYESKEECCGCSACYAACPKNAIRMIADEDGFVYPIIEEEQCVGCHICIRVCPFK